MSYGETRYITLLGEARVSNHWVFIDGIALFDVHWLGRWAFSHLPHYSPQHAHGNLYKL